MGWTLRDNLTGPPGPPGADCPTGTYLPLAGGVLTGRLIAKAGVQVRETSGDDFQISNSSGVGGIALNFYNATGWLDVTMPAQSDYLLMQLPAITSWPIRVFNDIQSHGGFYPVTSSVGVHGGLWSFAEDRKVLRLGFDDGANSKAAFLQLLSGDDSGAGYAGGSLAFRFGPNDQAFTIEHDGTSGGGQARFDVPLTLTKPLYTSSGYLYSTSGVHLRMRAGSGARTIMEVAGAGAGENQRFEVLPGTTGTVLRMLSPGGSITMYYDATLAKWVFAKAPVIPHMPGTLIDAGRAVVATPSIDETPTAIVSKTIQCDYAGQNVMVMATAFVRAGNNFKPGATLKVRPWVNGTGIGYSGEGEVVTVGGMAHTHSVAGKAHTHSVAGKSHRHSVAEHDVSGNSGDYDSHHHASGYYKAVATNTGYTTPGSVTSGSTTPGSVTSGSTTPSASVDSDGFSVSKTVWVSATADSGGKITVAVGADVSTAAAAQTADAAAIDYAVFRMP